MKIYLDTNVILDFLLNRKNFAEHAEKILMLSALDDNFEFTSSSIITDIFYIGKESYKISSLKMQEVIDKLTDIIGVLDVSGKDIKDALKLGWNDFEDAVQYTACINNDIDIIITRSVKDYARSEIPVFSPLQYIENNKNIFKNMPNCNELMEELLSLRDNMDLY